MEIFRPDCPVHRTQSNHLPHWSQAGAVTFITWRTNDSIPKEVAARWACEKAAWLKENGINTPSSEAHSSLMEKLSQKQKREYHRRFSRSWNHELDECFGDCLLRNKEISQIVKDSLLLSQSTSYEIDSFIVMPNHIHLLASFSHSDQMLPQVARWKRFTARKINEATGRNGSFWQPDCFDHLVRNRRQWEIIADYIRDNPKKANLGCDDYCYWERETR